MKECLECELICDYRYQGIHFCWQLFRKVQQRSYWAITSTADRSLLSYWYIQPSWTTKQLPILLLRLFFYCLYWFFFWYVTVVTQNMAWVLETTFHYTYSMSRVCCYSNNINNNRKCGTRLDWAVRWCFFHFIVSGTSFDHWSLDRLVSRLSFKATSLI